jgi:hypothetical protein
MEEQFLRSKFGFLYLRCSRNERDEILHTVFKTLSSLLPLFPLYYRPALHLSKRTKYLGHAGQVAFPSYEPHRTSASFRKNDVAYYST